MSEKGSVLSQPPSSEISDHEVAIHKPKVQTYLEQNQLHKEALAGHEWVYDELTRLYLYHPESFFHTVRVSEMYTTVAREIYQYQGADLALLARAGLTHDLGKLDISLDILNKPGKFEGFEYDDMQWHVVGSYERLMDHGDREVANIVVAHHAFAGNKEMRYPTPKHIATSDEEVVLKRRLLALSDVADALIRKRIYKEAFNPEDVSKILLTEKYGNEQEVSVVVNAGVTMSGITQLP